MTVDKVSESLSMIIEDCEHTRHWLHEVLCSSPEIESRVGEDVAWVSLRLGGIVADLRRILLEVER